MGHTHIWGCPAHSKILFCSKEVEKFITSFFAKNAVMDQFWGAESISGVVLGSFVRKYEENWDFCKSTNFHYKDSVVKL